ncbi:MAG: hypothetical protein ABI199_11140 [Bacteroidia bacterium]
MSLKKSSTKFFVLFICSVFNADADNYPLGARNSALGNTSVSLSDVWSAQNNQAGLAFLKNNSAAFYHEQRFGLKELSLNAATTNFSIKKGVFGITISSFGYSLYSENKFGIAYAKPLSTTFSIGVQLNYFHTHIADGYGNKGVLVPEIGLQKKLNEKLIFGVHFFNFTSTKLAHYTDERVPTIVRLGMNYSFSKQVIIALETEKDIQYNPLLKAGIEYAPRKNIFLRAGVSSEIFSFGFGLNVKQLQLDFSTTLHPTLGYTPQIGMSYRFDKKTN